MLRSERRLDGFTESFKDIGYQGVLPGDLVVHSMDGFAGAIGVSKSAGKMSPVVHIYAGTPTVDLRFVAYYLREQSANGQIEALAKGIRERSTSFDPATLADLRLPTPPIHEQRRIADFLDDQVARIDSIIAARQQQIRLSAAESRAALDALFRPDASLPTTRLGHFVRCIEQGWSPQCDAAPAGEGEWGVTKVSAVRAGRFVELENKRLPDGLEPMLEYEIRPGDLLVTRANTPALVGAFAVVPPGVRARLILCDKIMRLELDESLSAEYVALLGQTTQVRDRLSGAGTGTSQSMVNVRGSDIRDIPVVVRPIADQTAIVTRQAANVRASDEAERLFTSQVHKLAELKRSLITSAVTGGLDVSAADGSRVPV